MRGNERSAPNSRTCHRRARPGDLVAVADAEVAAPPSCWHAQLPQGRDDAFQPLFEETNNHGRLFGPHGFDGAYVFIGAFSREASTSSWPGHGYTSFNQARDDFARGLDAQTVFKSGGFGTA